MTSAEPDQPAPTRPSNSDGTVRHVDHPKPIVCEELHRRGLRRLEDMLVDYRDNSEVAAQPTQMPEEKDCIEHLANTENWFARHAEHCLKRITWRGPVSEWSAQFHQHLDRFAEAAVGADGGPGMWITRAQMDLLRWQTKACSEQSPCPTRLFVRTLFLIDITVPCHDPNEDSRDASFAEALKSKHPSLYEALIAALQRLNISDVLTLVTQSPEIEGPPLGDQRLLCEHLKAIIPVMTENVYSLAQGITPTIATND